MIPTPTHRLLRWTQTLLFITGFLALGFVGFSLLEAKLFQFRMPQGAALVESTK